MRRLRKQKNKTEPLTETPKNSRLDIGAIVSLGIAVAALFYPAVYFPPKSDQWLKFFNFSNLPEGKAGLLRILTYDTFGEDRFRPLTNALWYALYDGFHAYFEYQNAASLVLFFLCLTGFYFLAKKFSGSRWIAWLLSLLALSAYAHFDLPAYAEHIYILAALVCAFGGLFFLQRFYENGNLSGLAAFVLLFLAAIYFYEPFFALPALLAGAFAFHHKGDPRNKNSVKAPAILYAVFFVSFLAYRSIPRPVNAAYTASDLFSGLHIAQTLRTLAVNISYVNLGVHLLPWLGQEPGFLVDGSMLIMNPREKFLTEVEKFWPLILGALLFAFWHLKRYLENDGSQRWKATAAWAVLASLITSVGVLAFGRTLTNPIIYTYVQYRYQMFPDFMVLLLIALLAGELLRKNKERLVWIAALISISIAANAYYTHQSLSLIQKNWEGHSVLVRNIRSAITSGRIQDSARLYVNPEIVRKVSVWNSNIDKVSPFPGTIEWLFKDNGEYFTLLPEEAAFGIGKDLSVVELKP